MQRVGAGSIADMREGVRAKFWTLNGGDCTVFMADHFYYAVFFLVSVFLVLKLWKDA